MRNLFHRMNTSNFLPALAIAMSAGCAIEPEPDAPAADGVAEATQDITTLSGCEYQVDLQRETQTQYVPISTAGYAARGCSSFQFRVITGDHDWRAYVTWHGVNLDADPNACNNSLVFAALSRYGASGLTYLGTKIDHGAWGTVIGTVPVAGGSLPIYGCNPPDVNWGLGDHLTYQMGVFGSLSGTGPQGVYLQFVPLD
ncbi:MAG TPA: hypothetical protein VHT91_34560 [Kofleriaceae bacterium]|nr:hypothetical protein [Kofleriaceae bacterium]